MLKRIATYLSLSSLMVVSIAPMTTSAAPARRGNGSNAPRHVEKKSAPEFASTNGANGTVRVLMQTKGAPTADLDSALATARGNKRDSFSEFNTIVADVPLNQVASLAARSDVAYIAPDRPVKAQFNLTNDTTGATQVQNGLPQMPGFDGKGIGIAILDSGVSANHPDFIRNNQSRVVASVDFTGSTRSGDADGHGTGVAGVAAGSGEASTGYAANYAGVAPGADIIDVRVLDENGLGRTSNVLAAMNWVMQNRQRFNIRVVNLSMSTPVRESFHKDPLCKAVELRRSRGSGRHLQCWKPRPHRTDSRLQRRWFANLSNGLRRSGQPFE